MLGIVEGGDGALRDPKGASFRIPTRLLDGTVRHPGYSHSDKEDEDEGNNEEEEELPFEVFCPVHPATDNIDSQPEAELRITVQMTHLRNKES